MMPTKDVTQGVVASIDDTDLVMVSHAGGGWSPISFANLMKAVRGGIQIGGRNLLKNTADLSVTSSTKAWLNSRCVLTVDELRSEKALTFSCKYKKNGAPTSNIQIGAIYTPAWYETTTLTPNDLDDEGVIEKIFYPSHSNPTQFSLFAFSVDGVTLYDFKLERGNIATDWTPAPEDLSDLRGGVIIRLPISYDLDSQESQKGGAHEPTDQRDNGFVKECTDGYLEFGSLESACEYIGRACEDWSDTDRFGHLLFFRFERHKRSEDNWIGKFQFESSCVSQFHGAYQHPDRFHSLSYSSKRCHGRRNLFQSLLPTVATLEEGFNDRSITVARKEVAI